MVLLTALVLSVETIEALRPSRWAGCQGLMERQGVPSFSGGGPSVFSQIPTPIVAVVVWIPAAHRRFQSSRFLGGVGLTRLLASLGYTARMRIASQMRHHFKDLQSWTQVWRG